MDGAERVKGGKLGRVCNNQVGYQAMWLDDKTKQKTKEGQASYLNKAAAAETQVTWDVPDRAGRDGGGEYDESENDLC